MLTQIIYLALAYFYKKRNPQLGLEILLDHWPNSQWPEEFQIWWKNQRSDFTDQCRLFTEQGFQFTYPGCLDYPVAFLQNLDSPPLFLSYLGHPGWNSSKMLSVVGSRKMSSITKDWIQQELMGFLKNHDATIVSGGARGVDQAAHFCALRAKRPTFVFLPSGLNKIYPKDLNEWKAEIIKGEGAFISEYWPDEEIKKHYFIERNRLIAALAEVVLVTQGELRSGTMLTAQWALDLGRNIGVLPGHPMDSSFSGNLQLLRSGVPPVMDQQDLESLWNWGHSRQESQSPMQMELPLP